MNRRMESNESIFEVQAVLGKRVRRGTKEFLIRWRGFTAEDDSWEPESNLIGCQLLVKEFLQRTRTPSPGRKLWRSKANLQTSPTVEEFTKLRSAPRTRKSVGEPLTQLKVLHYKEAPQSPVVKSSRKVETIIHEKKELSIKEHETLKEVAPKEEKLLERKPRYRQVFLGWFMAITLFVLIMLFLASLLPVVNNGSEQPNTANI